MSHAWLREEQSELASLKILDAAARAFAELGVSGTRMGQIARYAGCSRGTVYRYFKTRRDLHLAYIDRSARRLSGELSRELAGIGDPRTRLVEGLLGALRKVREDPGLIAWFDPQDAGATARLSRDSDVVEALSAAFVDRLARPGEAVDANGRRARWLVRIIVSLLTIPAENEAEERRLVEEFVVPGLMKASPGAPREAGRR
ncbi:MAG TPA: TetR/AcrR family transcriptional regulator [Deltaproteobacteria bacterium]|nr:TetR/AcrR family transcriptional regulator [Deltaproteobacteria bacterium]